jgi:hypothetical protein
LSANGPADSLPAGGDLAVERHDFDISKVGIKPGGIAAIVPGSPDAVVKLTTHDHRKHQAGRS